MALLSGEHESSRGQLFVFVHSLYRCCAHSVDKTAAGRVWKSCFTTCVNTHKLVSRIPRATTINARIVYESLRPEQLLRVL